LLMASDYRKSIDNGSIGLDRQTDVVFVQVVQGDAGLETAVRQTSRDENVMMIRWANTLQQDAK
jgi:hypothetical protein